MGATGSVYAERKGESMSDLVNALFEFFGGCLLWMNVRQLWIDREIKGVAVLPTAFFMTWGYWNLYFYPSVNAWWSFYGGLNIVIANTAWVLLMLRVKLRIK
jgi:hypothetical protein